jgi:hypothetical protein
MRNRMMSNRRPPRTIPRTKYSWVLDDSPTAKLGLTISGAKVGVSVTVPENVTRCDKRIYPLYYNASPVKATAVIAQLIRLRFRIYTNLHVTQNCINVKI